MKTKRLRMRFLLASLLAVMLLAGLVGACTTETTPEPTPTPTTPAPEPTTPEPAPEPTPATEPEPAPAPATEPEPEPEVIKIIAHTTTPPTAAPGQMLDEWATKLEEMSGGRVEVVRYYASALFEQQEVIKSMLVGTADIHFDFMVGESPGLMKLNLFVDLPLLGFSSPEQGTKVLNGLLENIPEMKAEFQDLKVVYPTVYSAKSWVHSTKKLVLTTEDLQGLKSIAHGWSAKWYEAVGVTPVKLSWPEFYTSYEKGVVDTTIGAWGAHIGSGMIELSKYHATMPVCFNVGTVVNLMNPEKFASLPSDIQKYIDEDLDAWYAPRRTEIEGALDIVGVEMATEMGHEFGDISPEVAQEWVDIVQPIHQEWIAETEAPGVPAQAFFDELQRLMEEYE